MILLRRASILQLSPRYFNSVLFLFFLLSFFSFFFLQISLCRLFFVTYTRACLLLHRVVIDGSRDDCEGERERENGESEYDESSSCSIIFSCFREEILWYLVRSFFLRCSWFCCCCCFFSFVPFFVQRNWYCGTLFNEIVTNSNRDRRIIWNNNRLNIFITWRS